MDLKIISFVNIRFFSILNLNLKLIQRNLFLLTIFQFFNACMYEGRKDKNVCTQNKWDTLLQIFFTLYHIEF